MCLPTFSWDIPSPRRAFFHFFSIKFPCFQFIQNNSISSGSNLFSTAHFSANAFKVLLCRLRHTVSTCNLHPGRRWCTVSLRFMHDLHLPFSSNSLIFFHALVSIILNKNFECVFLWSVLHFK